MPTKISTGDVTKCPWQTKYECPKCNLEFTKTNCQLVVLKDLYPRAYCPCCNTIQPMVIPEMERFFFQLTIKGNPPRCKLMATCKVHARETITGINALASILNVSTRTTARYLHDQLIPYNKDTKTRRLFFNWDDVINSLHLLPVMGGRSGRKNEPFIKKTGNVPDQYYKF